MKPELRIELTRQLEQIRISYEGPRSRILFVVGTLAEIIVGAGFIGGAMRAMIAASAEDRLYWEGYAFVLLGVVILGHAGNLMFRRFLSRRLRLLYEAVLEVPGE